MRRRMKRLSYILLVAFAVLGCTQKHKNRNIKAEALKEEKPFFSLYKRDKFFIVGDFDGDKKSDTLYEHIVNKRTGVAIDSFPGVNFDELGNAGTEKYVDWIDKHNVDLYLALNNRKYDSLPLGASGGLYCLINMGDNNTDGTDEIALVTAMPGFMRKEYCDIYTLCGSQWVKLKSIRLYDRAFSYLGKESTNQDSIENFLEKRRGHWMYQDYMAEDNVSLEMIPLKIGKCH